MILGLPLGSLCLSMLNRSCNKVAYVLAKQVTNTHAETWHDIPTCVPDLVLFEAQAVSI